MLRTTVGFALFFPMLVACSSDTKDGTLVPEDAGTVDAASAPVGDAAPAVDAAVAPTAPTLTTLAQMSGGLHVMWKNGQKDCDTIEGERKSDTEAYKKVFSVPGVADNKHDGLGLTAGKAYTYRLRCMKGEMASDYSNEKTGTP
jgi:hypothetical protein